MSMEDLTKLIAGDLTKEEAKVFRTAGLKLLWRIGMVIFVMYALGLLAPLGLSGFARADQMNASVANLTIQVKDLGDAAREQTIQLLRTAIVDAQVKKCKAPKEETKAIYREQLIEAQARYYKLTATYYPEPACTDL